MEKAHKKCVAGTPAPRPRRLFCALARLGGAVDVNAASVISGELAGESTRNCSDPNDTASLRYKRAKNEVRTCTHSLINSTLYANTLCHTKSGCCSLDELMIKIKESISVSVTCGELDEQSANSQLLFINYWTPFMFGFLKPEDIRVIFSVREKIKICSNHSSIDASFEGDLLVAQPEVNVVSCNQSEVIENCVCGMLQGYPDTIRYVSLVFSVARRLVGCNSLSSPSTRQADTSGERSDSCGAPVVVVVVCAVLVVTAVSAFLVFRRRRRGRRAPDAVVMYNKQNDEAAK